MKIKIMIVSEDRAYTARFLDIISDRYSEKIEVCVFVNTNSILEYIRNKHVDIILLSPDMPIDLSVIPSSCQIVYFTEQNGVYMYGDYPAICKYQPVSMIYKQLLDIFTDKIESNRFKFGNRNAGDMSVLTFFSASGGSGASTIAAACAKYIAETWHENVLYLNLEQNGVADLYFHCNGTMNFSEVLYALAMNNNGTILKIQNCIKQDPSGVYFFSGAESSLEMSELSVGTLNALFQKIREIGEFKWVIVDMDFAFSELVYHQIKVSERSIFVLNCSYISKIKCSRLLNSLAYKFEDEDREYLQKIFTLTNRFSTKENDEQVTIDYPSLGTINKISNATTWDIINYISTQRGDIFEPFLH